MEFETKGNQTQEVDSVGIDTPLGPVRIDFSVRGLCCVSFDEGVVTAAGENPDRRVAGWLEEISHLAAGGVPRRRLPIDEVARARIWGEEGASSLRARAWRLIESIPHGQAWSYGELARRLGQPRAARAVARACAANPLLLLVPCHRVIRGDATAGGYSGGSGRKRALLEAEGVALA